MRRRATGGRRLSGWTLLALTSTTLLGACREDPIVPCIGASLQGMPRFDVIAALKAQGADDAVDLGERLQLGDPAGMSAPAREMRVRGIDVVWYWYCDPGAVPVDVSRFSADARTFDGKTLTWSVEPHVWSKVDVLVVYDGKDARLLALFDAVMGPEQKGARAAR